MKRNFSEKEKGVALYIAVVITGVLLLVSYAIINTAIKQLGISNSTRDSQAAFYAADSGIECALFWDLKGGLIYNGSAFSTSTTRNISCNNTNISVGGVATSTFDLDFLPEPYCATVVVGKSYNGNVLTTHIESRGYNSCDSTDLRRVERAIEVNY